MGIDCDESNGRVEGCFFKHETLDFAKSFKYNYDSYRPNYREAFHVTSKVDTKAGGVNRDRVQAGHVAVRLPQYEDLL